MIFGHLGVAMSARSRARHAPWLWLLVATYAPDGVDVVTWALGICGRAGLYSHALPALAAEALVLALAALVATRSAALAALLAALVFLHIPPDWITGEKVLWPGGPVLGLFFYRDALLDFVVEIPVIAAGWWLLRRSPRATPWLRAPLALVLLVAAQGAFDVFGAIHGSLKPNACGDPVPATGTVPARGRVAPTPT